DGGFTVIVEGLTKKTTESKIFYQLGDLGIMTFNKNAELIYSNLVRKNHQVEYGRNLIEIYPFYHHEYDRTAFPLFNGHQYKIFTFLNAKDANYVLMNELEKNITNQSSGNIPLLRR